MQPGNSVVGVALHDIGVALGSLAAGNTLRSIRPNRLAIALTVTLIVGHRLALRRERTE
jgi:hypothetical protein